MISTPRIVLNDSWLRPFENTIKNRMQSLRDKLNRVSKGWYIKDFATGHLFFGLHKTDYGWVFREWAPNAEKIYLVGDFSGWEVLEKYSMTRITGGNWEIYLNLQDLSHLDKYKLLIKWPGGEGYRLPSYGNYMVQDDKTKVFNACVWSPDKKFQWKNPQPGKLSLPALIYEAHVGMAGTEEKVSSFNEFTVNILPKIKGAGYNTIQLMAIKEHPYYGSFGYHVSNFFAVSSRFGTPDDLKELIDTAHGMGLRVVMDLVHSHSVKNEEEGLGYFDGTPYQYFHDSYRRIHPAWDSLCFNYSKNEVIHFLLSNCQYWLAEFKFDGFRFDGVTSMLYFDHGLGKDFTDYSLYYDGNQDIDAIDYLCLANKLVHEINPNAITIAEEMSGMPGLGAPIPDGGYGFDYRLAMGVPDFWIKLIKDIPDESWNMSHIFHELKSHRHDEKTISYAESHDQALVGDKTIFFRLVDKEIYTNMSKFTPSLVIDRGIALHKMIRLITMATAGAGYLNFMGNEFGHPEWIDFPREGNNWSYKYAKRQWHLAEDNNLKFQFLNLFDKAAIQFINNPLIFAEPFPQAVYVDDNKQILIFKRAKFLFLFNFHPSASYPEYSFPAEKARYQVVLSSDDEEFGGYNRVDKNYIYYTTLKLNNEKKESEMLTIYLPSRMAMVMEMIFDRL
ncbi:MAG: alpha-amylase family glycosyl hydrolase [Bacteroidales bacterium]